jgi:hypothetical protein
VGEGGPLRVHPLYLAGGEEQETGSDHEEGG